MVYSVPNEKDRQDIIAYLKTLSKYVPEGPTSKALGASRRRPKQERSAAPGPMEMPFALQDRQHSAPRRPLARRLQPHQTATLRASRRSRCKPGKSVQPKTSPLSLPVIRDERRPDRGRRAYISARASTQSYLRAYIR